MATPLIPESKAGRFSEVKVSLAYTVSSWTPKLLRETLSQKQKQGTKQNKNRAVCNAIVSCLESG